jgi:hypothetical protein
MRQKLVVSIIIALLGVGCGPDISGEWRKYSGDLGATKYSPLDQIDASNAGELAIARRRPAVDE